MSVQSEKMRVKQAAIRSAGLDAEKALKKTTIRRAGLRTEKQFFGPRGVFAKAGHTGHLKNPGILGVDDPVYNERVKFPKYSGPISPLSAHGTDGVKILVRRLPHFKKSDHAEHARAHARSAEDLDQHYQDLITDELADLKRKGIDRGPLISGVISGHFPAKVKNTLRQMATWITKHKGAAWLHDHAAHSRMTKNPDEAQVGFSSWPAMLDYIMDEGWEPLGKKNVAAFSRTVGSLFQILQKEARAWRVLYRTFLTAAAGPALSLGTYTTVDEAMIAANRQASDWIGKAKKNPITIVGNPGAYRVSMPGGRWKHFSTLEEATGYRSEVHRKTGNIVAVEKVVGKMARVSVSRPIGTKIADVGPGGKESNVIREGPGSERLNPPARVNTTIAGVLYNRCREIRAEKTSKTGLKGLYYHPFLERSKVMVLALDNGDILIHSSAGEKLWKLD